MIIIKLMGGLGNQLQQYALYQKFISLGKEVYLDVSWFDENNQQGMNAPRKRELDLFNDADYIAATSSQRNQLLGDKNLALKCLRLIMQRLHLKKDVHFYEEKMYHPEIFEFGDAYLEGYWAANKYYADILPILRQKLTFSDINEINQKIAKDMEECENACSVHIRRGDYLDANNAEMFGGIATSEYYDTAINTIEKEYPNTRFFIFSDDAEYVTAQYGGDPSCTIIDVNHGDNSCYDIFLMSKCRHHICANSTFSFWGARLSEKDGINIRPTIHKNSQVFVLEEMRDLWNGWTFINPQGELCE